MVSPHNSSSTTDTRTGQVEQQQWMEEYKRLQAYKVRYGHALVLDEVACAAAKDDAADSSETTGTASSLPTWLSSLQTWAEEQRSSFEMGTLSKEREDLLNEIKFVWDLDTPGAKRTMEHESRWFRLYGQLKTYQQERKQQQEEESAKNEDEEGDETTKTTYVPSKYLPDPVLGKWAENQRTRAKAKTLPQCRKLLLDEIGFAWRSPLYGPPPVRSKKSPITSSTTQQQRATRGRGSTSATTTVSITGSVAAGVLRKRRRSSPASRASTKPAQTPPAHQEAPPSKRSKRAAAAPTAAGARKAAAAAKPTAAGVATNARAVANEKRWFDLYEKLRAYQQGHSGDSSVPWNYKGDKVLTKWVDNQKTLANRGELRSDRRRLLEEIGFFLSSQHHSSGSRTNSKSSSSSSTSVAVPTKIASSAITTRGGRTIKRTYKRTYNSQMISVSTSTSTTRGKGHSYNNQVIFADSNEALWHSKYELLVDFQAKYGHTRVPQGRSNKQTTEQDRVLGNWVMTQRVLYNNGNLRPERERLLNDIGFIWDGNAKTWRADKPKTQTAAVRPKSSSSSSSSSSSKKLAPGSRKSSHEEYWFKLHERLQAFKAKFGTAAVPWNYQTDPALAKWVENQRFLNKNGNLRADRRKLLNQIGFVWRPGTSTAKQASVSSSSPQKNSRKKEKKKPSPPQTASSSAVKKAKPVKKVAVSSAVKKVAAKPVMKVTTSSAMKKVATKPVKKVATKAAAASPPSPRQKQSATTKSMTEFDARWFELYGRLCAYHRTHGNASVPWNYEADKVLANWLAKQRTNELNGRLRADRRKLLNDLGVVWSTATVAKLEKNLQEKKTKSNSKRAHAPKDKSSGGPRKKRRTITGPFKADPTTSSSVGKTGPGGDAGAPPTHQLMLSQQRQKQQQQSASAVRGGAGVSPAAAASMMAAATVQQEEEQEETTLLGAAPSFGKAPPKARRGAPKRGDNEDDDDDDDESDSSSGESYDERKNNRKNDDDDDDEDGDDPYDAYFAPRKKQSLIDLYFM